MREHPVLRIEGLNEDAALVLPPSRSARHLGQQLEGPFERSEIRVMQHPVGLQDPDQAHVLEIESLGDHLGPDQHLDVAGLERLDDPLVSRPGARRVEVHPRRLDLRKMVGDFFLDALRANALGLHLLASAPRAGPRFRLPVAAVVTVQVLEVFVVGQGHIAPRAFRNPAAGPALVDRSIAAPVLEQDHLASSFQRLSDGLEQGPAEVTLHPALLVGLAQVHQLHGWQRGSAEAFLQRHMPRPVLAHGPPGLERGRSRPQQHLGSMEVAEHRGRIASLVARGGILLLVAGVVLFVHDDEPEVAERQEHGAPRPHQQAPLALFLGHAAEGGGALPRRESAVVDLEPVTEEPTESDDQLGGQGDLRNEEEGVATGSQHVVDEVRVHLGLPGTGDPFKEDQPLLSHALPDGVEGRLLRRAQGRQGQPLLLAPAHPRILLEQEHHPLVHEPFEDLGIEVPLLHELGHRHSGSVPGVVEEGHHRPGLGGRPGIHVVQLLPQPGFVRGSALRKPHHGHHLSAGTVLHLLIGEDPARFDQTAQDGSRVLDTKQLAHLLEGHGTPEPQGLHDLEFPVVQVGVVAFLRIRSRLEFGLAGEPHPRWQGGEGHLSWRTAIVPRHPIPEPQRRLGEKRLGIQQAHESLSPVAGSLSVNGADDGGVEPLPTQRDNHPTAHADGPRMLRRNGIGQQPGEREGKDDVDILHEKRKYLSRVPCKTIGQPVNPGDTFPVLSPCITSTSAIPPPPFPPSTRTTRPTPWKTIREKRSSSISIPRTTLPAARTKPAACGTAWPTSRPPASRCWG